MSERDDCIRCDPAFSFASLTVEELTTTDREFNVCPNCSGRLNPMAEATRYCPVDGEAMRKLVIYDVVLIDKCYHCGGVWLDNNELRVIEKVVSTNAALGGFMLGRVAD
ncbi:MAG TPA: zf-TFIIB domain-containing protein [Pyrinomonadaceae bacterium]|jgi:DNA-directed RNA polymerase subunit RPC12/RpoP